MNKDSCEGPVDWKSFGSENVAGVDEAGRGCLAGPVFSAAVIFSPDTVLPGLTDSKLLTPEQRLDFALKIKSVALAWAVGMGSVAEIEELNILQASLLAMKRAVQKLKVNPGLLLIDGNQMVPGSWRQETIVRGDLRCFPISAASILAKVERDNYMIRLDGSFPGYDFAVHKGYGTPTHRKAIASLGPTPIHRKTFAGVREFLSSSKSL